MRTNFLFYILFAISPVMASVNSIKSLEGFGRDTQILMLINNGSKLLAASDNCNTAINTPTSSGENDPCSPIVILLQGSMLSPTMPRSQSSSFEQAAHPTGSFFLQSLSFNLLISSFGVCKNERFKGHIVLRI